MYPVELRSARLVVREFVNSDCELLNALYGDQRVVKHLSFPQLNPDQCQQLVINAINDAEKSPRTVYFLIADSAELPGVGVVRLGLDEGSIPSLSAEIGLAILASRWGSGLGLELASMAIEFAFQTLHLESLSARRAPENVASEALLRNLGFDGDEMLVDEIVKAGEPEDRIRSWLSSDQWRRRRFS